MEDIEKILISELVTILGYGSADEIKADSALGWDLGADSIDFLNIFDMIDRRFGVKLKVSEITLNNFGSKGLDENIRVSPDLVARLNSTLDSNHFKEGMMMSDIFPSITVHNLAVVVSNKMKDNTKAAAPCL